MGFYSSRLSAFVVDSVCSWDRVVSGSLLMLLNPSNQLLGMPVRVYAFASCEAAHVKLLPSCSVFAEVPT